MFARKFKLYLYDICRNGLYVLTPEKNEQSYFYIMADKYKSTGKVYLYFEDQRYNFEYNQLEICYTDENPKSDTAVSNCEFKRIKYYQRILNSDRRDKYYYSFDYIDKDIRKPIFRDYVIVHFNIRKALDGMSIFSVKTSTNDIYEEDMKKGIKKILSIIFIIIGSIIALATIGLIIYFCCKKKKRIEIQGYPAPQPNLAISNPIDAPYVSPIPINPINDPNALFEKPSPLVNPV